MIKTEINEWHLFNIEEKLWNDHSMKTYHARGLAQVTGPEVIIKNILISAGVTPDGKKI